MVKIDSKATSTNEHNLQGENSIRGSSDRAEGNEGSNKRSPGNQNALGGLPSDEDLQRCLDEALGKDRLDLMCLEETGFDKSTCFCNTFLLLLLLSLLMIISIVGLLKIGVMQGFSGNIFSIRCIYLGRNVLVGLQEPPRTSKLGGTCAATYR